MIFITLGSQKFQFNRLLIAIDEQITQRKIIDPVFAQTGYSDYVPQNFEYKNFLNRDEFSQAEEKSDIVITHGGSGAIIGALKKHKKVIAVPRLAKYGEHVDDHQLQLVDEFRNLNLIYECIVCDDLWKAVAEINERNFTIYRSNTTKIISNIEEYIGKEFRK